MLKEQRSIFQHTNPITPLILLFCFFWNSPGLAEGTEMLPKRGQPLSAEEVTQWQTSIYPDGRGLPNGQGIVSKGAELFALHCATCHGEGGIGGSAEELSGGMQGLTGEYPDKTIGTYWPYATTLFDFIQRAMPLYAPGSLTVDETYALVAYLLYQNEVIEEGMVVNEKNLPKIVMPNRDGFVSDYWP